MSTPDVPVRASGIGVRWPFLLLVALSIAPFLPALFSGEILTFRDNADYFSPLRYYTAVELRAGRLPLWNPYSASGEPWLANPQTGVFYPPAWIFLVLPFARAYVLYAALHLVIAAVGTFRMLETRVSPAAATVGAVALMFAGPVFSLIDITNNFTAFAWLPWVMWAALSRAGARTSGALIALSFLAGEPFYAALGAAVYCLVVCDVRRIVKAGITAAGLSAIQLLPFLEMVWDSDRAAGLSAEQMLVNSAAARDWLRLFVPPHLPPSMVDPDIVQHFIPVVYSGMTTGVLAVIALLFVRSRYVAGLVALLMLALVVSIAPQLPPVVWLLQHMPVTLFRYPARMIPIGALALAALAASGWDRVRPNRAWADASIVVLLLLELLPFSTRLLQSEPFAPSVRGLPAAMASDSKLLRVRQPKFFDSRAWVSGYLNLYDRRFDAWTAAPLTSARYDSLYRKTYLGIRRDLVDRLPCGWLIADRLLGPPFDCVRPRPDVWICRNPQVLPMAAVWSSVDSAETPQAALARLFDHSAPGDVVVSPPPGARYTAGDRKMSAGAIAAMSGDEARVTTNASFPGVLVLTQRDAPGWHVFVDGRPAPKLLADGNFRAVAIDSGPHVIEWKYLPPSLLAGSSMTAVTLVSLLFMAFVKRRRARKFSS